MTPVSINKRNKALSIKEAEELVKEAKDVEYIRKMEEEKIKKMAEERKIRQWENQIFEMVEEVLDERYEDFRVHNKTALNINSIENEVRRRIRREVSFKEKKYFSEAFRIFSLRQILDLFEEKKTLLEKVVHEQREREEFEKLAFNKFLERLRKEQFSKFYEDSISTKQYNFEKKEIREKLGTLFDLQFNQNNEFNYINMHIKTFQKYLRSREFDDDFRHLMRKIKQYIRKLKREKKMERRGISDKWRYRLIIFLSFIAITFLIILII